MKKVLIVDDVPDAGQGLKMKLEASGRYEADVLDNGDYVINQIKKIRYDLIILDIRMKTEDEGIKIGSEIRDLQRKGEIEQLGVFLITSSPDSKDAERAINDCQPDGFIDRSEKESKERIIERLDTYFNRRGDQDRIIRAFKAWVDSIEPDDYKFHMSYKDGRTKTLNAKDILNEMIRGTEFGNNFYESIIESTIDMIKE
jgi:CheY-like chemotaxis protein